MILIALFSSLLTVVMWLFGSVNLPALPIEVMSGLSFFVNAISGGVQFLIYILGAPLFAACLLIVPAVIFLQYTYAIIRYIVRILTAGFINL